MSGIEMNDCAAGLEERFSNMKKEINELRGTVLTYV